MARSKAEELVEAARQRKAAEAGNTESTNESNDTAELDGMLGEIMGAELGDTPSRTTVTDAPPPAPEPAPEPAPTVKESPEPEQPKVAAAPISREMSAQTKAELEAGRAALAKKTAKK
jgi:hypothetical protein